VFTVVILSLILSNKKVWTAYRTPLKTCYQTNSFFKNFDSIFRLFSFYRVCIIPGFHLYAAGKLSTKKYVIITYFDFLNMTQNFIMFIHCFNFLYYFQKYIEGENNKISELVCIYGVKLFE
jgi:hypothetical protein